MAPLPSFPRVGLTMGDVLRLIDRPHVDEEMVELQKELLQLNVMKLRQELGGAAVRQVEIDELAAERRDFVLTGKRGGGKSITALAVAAAYKRRGWRVVRFLYGPGAVTEPRRLPLRCVCVVDEAVAAFASFRGRMAPQEFAEAVGLARHDERVFIYACQASGQLHPEITRLEYCLGVKGPVGMRQVWTARPDLRDDLKRARADLMLLPRRQSTTWWSLDDDELVWTQNGFVSAEEVFNG